MKKHPLLILAGVAALAVPMVVAAQPSTDAGIPKGVGRLYFNSNVGSFKILGNAVRKAEGSVQIECKGTVLVSGLEGTVTPVGMREEIHDTKLQKRVFFGKGQIKINGKFGAIQFFGRDMKAVWTGWGVVRLFGEFDKNLNTGEFWYEGSKEKRFWSNGGMQVALPKPEAVGGDPTSKPIIRDKG